MTNAATNTSIPTAYFGMTIESPDYNYSYLGGPVEAQPTIPIGVVRSWDVWSPGNGQVEYLDWSDINPSSGVYNWTALDAWIALNQATNTQMVYTFGDPPAWAGGTTTNLADFQAFVTAIVTQANGAIKYWEGFNEFDVSGIAPALLVQMQEIIYNTVHTLDPGALVLSPTVCAAGDDPLFAQFLADGGGNYFDIAAFHGYNNSTGEGIVPVVQDFQAVLSQYGLSNVPIWDTEWGMEAPNVITDTTTQEAYVSTGLILQAAVGVQTEIFYAYDNANSALYDTATGQLTPAGVAYQQTEQWLTGATEPSGYQLNGSVYTVQLTKNGQNDLIVWNSSGQSSYAAGPYTQYVDTQGQVHTIVNGVVTLGTVPILLETPMPAVASVAASGTGITNGNGDLSTGSVVTLTLSMTEAVTVAGGTPTLTLNDGGTATYTGNSGGTALTFSYTVAAGQNTSDLSVSAVNLNGATVKDGAGNTASLSGTLSPAGTLQIDTTAPTVASVATSGTGIANGNGDVKAGSAVTLTLTMSEAVTVAGGTPTLTLNDGGTATYTGGSGGTALTFSYTVAAGQNTADLSVSAVNLNGATIKDGAGNSANLSGTLSPAGTLQIDTTAPTVASVATSGTGITNGNGDLKAGSAVTLTLTMSEAVTVAGGTPTLTLNDGGTATYIGGSGGTALTFSYTVAAGQNTADLSVSAVNLNGATIKDGAGNSASLSGTLSPAGTLQIDTTAPTMASVATSGTGIANGNGDLKAGSAVTLTLTMSEAVTVAGGTPTLTLNDGGTATYTGGSGGTALTFSYTVAAGQNTADLSVSAFNLNGATVKDGAGNSASLSGTLSPAGTLQIDTTAPTVASVATSGTGITNGNGDLKAGSAVTLTLTMSEAVTVAGGTPMLTLNDGGTATYTGGSGTVLTFSYTVAAGQNTADLSVSAVNLNGATIKDGAGNSASLSGTLSPAGTLQIDTTAPAAPIISSEKVVGNRAILSGTAEAGSTVSIYEGSTLLGTTSVNSKGAWAFATPTETKGAHTFTATATDAAGNVSARSSPIDPTIDEGPTVTATTIEIGNQYFIFNAAGSSVPLELYGSGIVEGQLGGWTPIGAVQTASGYDVAWQLFGTNQYTIWSTDNDGNYITNLVGSVSGNSTALESYETVFNQDLNGDGTIGVVTTVLQTDGSTSLTTQGNQYYLANGGSSVALQLSGSGIAVGQLGGWTPIGAVQTASGYDVAWQLIGSNQYTIWSTDRNGNYITNLVGAVSGNSAALEVVRNSLQSRSQRRWNDRCCHDGAADRWINQSDHGREPILSFQCWLKRCAAT